jgi:hypothetical protein
MSSRGRKAELQHIRDAETRERAVSTPRYPHTDISYAGVGRLRYQVAWWPPFEAGVVFDVRSPSFDEDLLLFRSSSISSNERLLVGYRNIPADQKALAAFLERLKDVSLPLLPPVEPFGVADGTLLELAVGVAFSSTARVAWCESYAPAPWAALEPLVQEMLRTFKALAAQESKSG